MDQHYFRQKINITDNQFSNLVIYANLLEKWQKSFNLVGPNTLMHLWSRHFLDSAQLLGLVQKNSNHQKGVTWLDFGAGAGFPGLIISILGGGKVNLVESCGKKCSFMRAVIRETGNSAVVHQERIEDLKPFNVDIITARALAPLKNLLRFSEPFVSQKVELWYLKGQDVDDELAEATKYWNADIDKYSSQTNRAGTILCLRNLSRVIQKNKSEKYNK
ncbi:MAG: 16S rRNA (guanine(527)-N(7))-methyltransferase RsmG [Sphingomonadales bacterium]